MPRRMLAMLLLAAGTIGCQPASVPGAPAAVTSEARQAAPALHGRIEPTGRAAQATVPEIASGATLALIDATTGQTLATTLAGADGTFQLQLPGVTAIAGRPYYLEAVKGLSAGGTPNRIGAVAARLRTVVFLQGGDWVSLNSPTLGQPVVLSEATTAAAIIGALRGLPLSSLIGTVQIGGVPFSPNGGAVSVAEFNVVYALVDQALQGDRDPVEGVGYDPTGATPASQYGLKPGELQIAPATPFSVSPGGTVTLAGQNLPVPRSDTLVYVGDQAVGWTVNASRTQMVLTIPATGYGGWVRVVQGATTWPGPYVGIRGTVGTYIGTIAGTAFPVTTDLQGPTATFGGNPVAIDAAGNVYSSGVGADANGIIVKIQPNGTATTVVQGNALLPGVPGLAVDGSGNLYAADRNHHRILKITSGGAVSVFAGSGTSGAADGQGTAASFSQPSDVAVDGSGTVYVADLANHKIRKITPGGLVSTFAGTGAGGATDGATSSATFNQPYGIAVDATGTTVYVGEWSNNVVRKITGGVVSVLAGSPGLNGFQDGTGTGARFATVKGVAVDGGGNVYVADAGNHAVRKVTPGGVVTTLAGAPPPTAASGSRNGPPGQSRLNFCHYVAVGPGNVVYMGDAVNALTRLYTP